MNDQRIEYALGDGTLPPVAFRDRIAGVVQQAIEEISGTDGLGLCWLYAMAGALLLSVLDGAMSYHWQAGTFQVLAGEDDLWMAFDAEQGGVAASEYHAWICRFHPQAAPGRSRLLAGERIEIGGDQEHGLEIVDLSARHYRQYARLNGLPWDRPEPPEYVWGWLAAVKAKGLWMTADQRAMRDLTARRDEALMRATADRALALYRAGANVVALSRQQRRAAERRTRKGERGGTPCR